jgi:serine protease Do
MAHDGEVSASWGIISNLSRRPPLRSAAGESEPTKESLYDYGGLIQTDARLHTGTSGGALINLKGEMIGLTTALGATEGYERSLGFAIPVDDAFRRTVETLKAGRKAEVGFLGVAPQDLSDAVRRQGRHGAEVSHVVPGTPAFAAGLREGDIITRLNDVPIYDRDTLMLELGRQPVGASVRLTAARGATAEKRGREIVATAQLSKKYLGSSRPAFAQVADPSWRGIQVDYATALPQTLSRQSLQEALPGGCLAVIDVDRDSPAWKAGLRPAMLLTHVGERRVSNPDQFFAAVKDKTGAVPLRLAQGSPNTIVIPPSK